MQKCREFNECKHCKVFKSCQKSKKCKKSKNGRSAKIDQNAKIAQNANISKTSDIAEITGASKFDKVAETELVGLPKKFKIWVSKRNRFWKIPDSRLDKESGTFSNAKGSKSAIECECDWNIRESQNDQIFGFVKKQMGYHKKN